MVSSIKKVPSDGEMSISRLDESQWEKYRELRLEALISSPTSFSSSYDSEIKLSEEVWKARIGNAIFALVEGKPVGMMGYMISHREKENHFADIFGMFVKEEFRKRGIASRMMDWAINDIRNRGDIIKINLSVVTTETPAVKLYEKKGFTIVGKLNKQLKVNGKYYDEYIMEFFL